MNMKKNMSIEEIKGTIESAKVVGQVYAKKNHGYLTVTLENGTIRNLVFTLGIYEAITKLISIKQNQV